MDLERRCVHNVSHHEGGVYMGGDVLGGRKGRKQRNLAAKLSKSLQHLASSCERWATVGGTGCANKDPLEGSLILVGRLTGRSARSAPSQLELGSLCQNNCLLRFSFWTELQVPSDRQHPCLSPQRAVPPLPCPVNDCTYHFRQARSTKGGASYWYVRGCVVCAWDHFPSLGWQSSSADGVKSPPKARGIRQTRANKKWNTWKLVTAI